MGQITGKTSAKVFPKVCESWYDSERQQQYECVNKVIAQCSVLTWIWKILDAFRLALMCDQSGNFRLPSQERKTPK
jgi:hypothetical protein